jgi:hypothetical protein
MKAAFIPVLATVAMLFGAAPSAQAVEVLGELQNRSGKTIGAFEGTLDIVEFYVDDEEKLVADALVSGDVINRAGKVIRSIEDVPVTLPVTGINAAEHEEPPAGEVTLQQSTCEILSLSLGPLDLNLLGLMIHLDEVNLDITADPAGGLLGDLLCALADGLGIDLGDLLGNLGALIGIHDLLGELGDFLDLLNLLDL